MLVDQLRLIETASHIHEGTIEGLVHHWWAANPHALNLLSRVFKEGVLDPGFVPPGGVDLLLRETWVQLERLAALLLAVVVKSFTKVPGNSVSLGWERGVEMHLKAVRLN